MDLSVADPDGLICITNDAPARARKESRKQDGEVRGNSSQSEESSNYAVDNINYSLRSTRNLSLYMFSLTSIELLHRTEQTCENLLDDV